MSLANLFEQYRAQLIQLSRGIVGSRDLAEDIVQDAFVRYASKVPEDTIDQPIAYLAQSVKNLSYDEVKSRAREQQVLKQEFGEANLLHLKQDGLFAQDTPTDEETHALVYEALQELPVETRRAVVMHIVEGKKIREIAEKMGMSVGKAHSLVKDGTKHCRERIVSRRTRS